MNNADGTPSSLDRLRRMREQDPWRYGEEVLREMEDRLRQLARDHGWQDDGKPGGFGTYVGLLENQRAIPASLRSPLDQARALRDALSHLPALAVAPSKADELLRILDALCRCGASTARQVMSSDPA